MYYRIVIIVRSYQNQFITNVNYHTFVIFAKAQQHAERHTKIKVPIVVKLFAVSLESRNLALCKLCCVSYVYCVCNFIRKHCITLHKTSPMFLLRSICISFSSYRILSNMSAMQLHPSFGRFCIFSSLEINLPST